MISFSFDLGVAGAGDSVVYVPAEPTLVGPGDLALVSGVAGADALVLADDLATDAGLVSAVRRSLFEDRRAQPGDLLPDGETDRRGWWADDVDGDQCGSRLWLLARAKNTPDTLARAEEYTREALAWLVDDKVASRIDVSAQFLAAPRGLAIYVVINRPGKADPVRFRFGAAWAAEEVR